MSDQPIQPTAEPPNEGIWCVVANVAPIQENHQTHEVRLGTKHFTPNTKVYCFPPEWGDGYEHIRVIGRLRGTARLIKVIMPSKRLINWRVKHVYEPYVVREVPGWDKDRAEGLVASMIFRHEAQQAKKQGLDTVAPNDALMYALYLYNFTAARNALERGADANYRRPDGRTPLDLAIAYRRGIVPVRLLLEYGARLDTIEQKTVDDVQRIPALYDPEVVQLVNQRTKNS